jgi:hypothetical protein
MFIIVHTLQLSWLVVKPSNIMDTTNTPGPGVSPISPRARATPMGAINEEKKKKN